MIEDKIYIEVTGSCENKVDALQTKIKEIEKIYSSNFDLEDINEINISKNTEQINFVLLLSHKYNTISLSDENTLYNTQISVPREMISSVLLELNNKLIISNYKIQDLDVNNKDKIDLYIEYNKKKSYLPSTMKV